MSTPAIPRHTPTITEKITHVVVTCDDGRVYQIIGEPAALTIAEFVGEKEAFMTASVFVAHAWHIVFAPEEESSDQDPT